MITTIPFLIWPFGGLKAKKPLKEEEFEGTKKAIRQKRAVQAELAASQARKEERNVRKDLRKISYKVKEASKILSSLQQAVAQQKPEVIRGNWKKWKGELNRLESLKVEIGAYAALVAKILAETAEEISISGSKDELKTYKADLLKNTKAMESQVAIITKNVQMITPKIPAGDDLWTMITSAIESASNFFQEILTDGEAALALEQKVREDLGRA